MDFSKIVSLLRRFSFTPLALVLLCFFLTFVSLSSCGGQQKLYSANGYQVAFGTEIQQPQMFGPPRIQNTGISPPIILVLLLTIAGIVMSFVKINAQILKVELRNLLVLLFSGMALFLMLLFKFVTDYGVRSQSNGMVQVDYGAGFILTVLLLLLSLVLQGIICFLQLTGKDYFGKFIKPTTQ